MSYVVIQDNECEHENKFRLYDPKERFKIMEFPLYYCHDCQSYVRFLKKEA